MGMSSNLPHHFSAAYCRKSAERGHLDRFQPETRCIFYIGESRKNAIFPFVLRFRPQQPKMSRLVPFSISISLQRSS